MSCRGFAWRVGLLRPIQVGRPSPGELEAWATVQSFAPFGAPRLAGGRRLRSPLNKCSHSHIPSLPHPPLPGFSPPSDKFGSAPADIQAPSPMIVSRKMGLSNARPDAVIPKEPPSIRVALSQRSTLGQSGSPEREPHFAEGPPSIHAAGAHR